MNTDKLSNFGAKLATTTALVSLAFAYGARNTARAGVCAGGAGVYSCSGPAGADTGQYMTASGVTVTTTSGFGLNSSDFGVYMIATGPGGVSFDDSGNPGGSAITSSNGDAVAAVSTGGGAVSITTNGAQSPPIIIIPITATMAFLPRIFLAAAMFPSRRMAP